MEGCYIIMFSWMGFSIQDVIREKCGFNNDEYTVLLSFQSSTIYNILNSLIKQFQQTDRQTDMFHLESYQCFQ